MSTVPESEKKEVVTLLQNIGCCDLCVLRYLGITDPHVYRNDAAIKIIMNGEENNSELINVEPPSENSNAHPVLKCRKMNTCVACLGLLQEGVKESCLDEIVSQIKSAEIESSSFNPVLSMPLSIQIRAYSIWNYLEKNFPKIFNSSSCFKPEGMALKSVWKWVCSGVLQHKVNPASHWSVDGSLSVHMHPSYPQEEKECEALNNYLTVGGFGRRKFVVSRGSVESALSRLNRDNFDKYFPCPPTIPDVGMTIGDITCTHAPVYIAGRYCKYSRKLSQTPWFVDGARKTETSVEELITSQILPMFGSETATFSASGREDVDVRMLGRGRPFVIEVSNPKKTIFSKERMKQLQEAINRDTKLISVCDIQIVDKKELIHIKQGEETKTKSYCALCITPGNTVSSEVLDKLNNVSVPLVLQQKTPVRVIHRRSVACRERSIIEIKAIAVPSNPNLFKLYVKTQAGTYVKEFVHGDLGRTTPNVSALLGRDADIIGLDVECVELDWPPEISDVEKSI